MRAHRAVAFGVAIIAMAGTSQPIVAAYPPVDSKSDQVSEKRLIFESDILPIFKANCVQCHGPGTMTKSMNLGTYAGVMKGSESGPVVVPRQPEASLLYKKVHEGEMPKGGKPLSADQVELIRNWIAAGAPAAMTFEQAVLPIFQSNCVQCHGSTTKLKDLDLSTMAGVMKGSESGAVVAPGSPDESRLYKVVRDGSMPKGGKPLSQDQIAAIRGWIEAGAPSASQTALARAEPLTEHDILPILFLRCTTCHGWWRREGGLDLHTRAAMLKGGKSGPGLAPGKPEESLMIKKIRSGEMPPKKLIDQASVKRITSEETERLARWIAQGAPEGNVHPDVAGNGPDPLVTDKDRQFWSFQPPKRPTVPSVTHSDRVRNPIDAFILARLEAKGVSLSPEADKLTLIRRATFDLTGLPPAPEEVQAFLADRNPNAYEKLIDRLLASPRYGERWGRYWLDLAGYTDSEGGKLSSDNVRRHAWLYRDYVIRSLNSDKPYDRFLLEQIAGDELVDYERAKVVTQEFMDNLIATGFLRMGPDSTYDPTTNYVEDRLDVIADELDILGAGVMGLTVRCARCHSHKYDPIPQRDYYRLVAVFKGAFDYYDWLMPQPVDFDGKPHPAHLNRFLPFLTPGATPAQIMEEPQLREVHNTDLDRQIGELKTAMEERAEPIKKKLLDPKLAQVPKVLQEDLRKALATPAEERNQIQRYLVEKFNKSLKVETEELKKSDPDFRRWAEETERQIKLLEAKEIPEPLIRALWDRGEPTPTYILRRGDAALPGALVGPGVPAVLTDGKTPFEASPPWPGAHSTGRRLAFARWLTRSDIPLTARVMINRIWAHHFGVGIVKTLGNFGRTGAPPAHPELLDWLATEFVRQGWSMKTMHRLMMTSSTYRQSSTVTPALEKVDLDNVFLSRMPLKRMEAELLYDTLVMVSGNLDETQFGPPEPVEVREDGLVTPIRTEKGWRRSIYVAQRRTELPTLLDSFDLPSMSPNCLERNTSTVAIQALHLMNNNMVERLAALFAERLKKEVGSDPGKLIERAYWIALSRPPTPEEKKVSFQALARFEEIETKKIQGSVAATRGPSALQGASLVAVSASSRPPQVKEDGNLSALAEFCHALVNSAAFLYID